MYSLMTQALELATASLTLSSPNPRVGCVIANPAGRVLGRGNTQHAGGPHAEIMALRDATAQGHSVVGASAYVTLEPCSHHGRTGPCCDALIGAGIKRVVASITDPNPLVSGRGFEKLRTAGVEVETGPGASESRELNLGFFSRMVRKTPWVRMKIAASLDGKTALDNGSSQWITSEASRADGHAWRARSCALLTGIGTVLHDDPRLDVRLAATERQPHLVIADSRLQTPLSAHIFIAGRALSIYAAAGNGTKQRALQDQGVRIVLLSDGLGKVDLAAMLRDLANQEINELHVEAGPRLNGALIQAGLVDEFVIYLAPKLIGQGKDMARFGPIDELSAAVPLEFTATERLGPDLRLIARVRGRDQF